MVIFHANPLLGEIKLQKLKNIEIQNMVNQIIADGGSPRLAESAFNVLRIALNKAFTDEIITRLPFRGVSIPQKLKTEFTPLTDEEWTRLFEAAQKYPAIYTALMLEWATGISRSELLALTWPDINFEIGTVSILRADIITDDGPEINNTKAPTRRRVLPVPDITMQELIQHKKRQASDRLAAKVWENNDLVFPTSAGRLQDPRNWSKKFARVAKAAGIAISFHKLRHDHASRLSENGVSIKDAQYRLGHSTSRMLLDVYTHRMTSGQEKIAAWLDKSFPDETKIHKS